MSMKDTGYKLTWAEYLALGAVFVLAVAGIIVIASSKETSLQEWYAAHPEVVHKCCNCCNHIYKNT